MTHGRGKKAGRGAGLRGGRGNAGLLKHKYMYMLKNMPDHFGRHGFKRPQSVIKRENTINIGQLEERYPGKNEIDLTKAGFDKLLGAGEITTKLKITVNSASEKAIEKIKEKGGEVKVLKVPKEEKPPAEEPPKKEEPVEEITEEKPSEPEGTAEPPKEEVSEPETPVEDVDKEETTDKKK